MNAPSLIAHALVILTVVAFLAPLSAQNNAVVPNTNETAEGTGTNQPLLLVGSAATVQLFVDDSQLANFASGDLITGISVRMNGAVADNATLAYTQFDITCAQADTASSTQGLLASTTFADNLGSTPVSVRTGALSIAAGEIPGGATPNVFLFVIPFTTPYTHSVGTDIVITIRMSGFTGTAVELDNVDNNQASRIDWQAHLTSNSATVATSTTNGSPIIQLVSEPEMDVLDGSTPVADGGTTTHTGTVYAGIPFTHVMTIENNGVETLTITTPVAAPGALSNCSATILVQPASSVLAGNSTTITVQITATAAGAFSCTVSIGNNDRDENPYEFTIDGTSNPPSPEMDVFHGTTAVADGGTSAIGDVDFGVNHLLTYRIENNGSATLNLTGTPSVTATTGVNITLVGINTLPATSIAAGNSTTVVLFYQTTAASTWSFTISIDSDDPDEDPYTWTVVGTSTNKGNSGGNGGGDEDESSCSSASGQGFGWMMLAGLLSVVVIALRTSRRRA